MSNFFLRGFGQRKIPQVAQIEDYNDEVNENFEDWNQDIEVHIEKMGILSNIIFIYFKKSIKFCTTFSKILTTIIFLLSGCRF